MHAFRSCSVLSLSLDCFRKAVETRLPKGAVAADPRIDFAEGLGSQGIEATCAVGTHAHESSLLKDAKVPRNAGLVDVDAIDDVIDLLLAYTQSFEDVSSSRIGQGLENIKLHRRIYT